jgi:hypothetical protein
MGHAMLLPPKSKSGVRIASQFDIWACLTIALQPTLTILVLLWYFYFPVFQIEHEGTTLIAFVLITLASLPLSFLIAFIRYPLNQQTRLFWGLLAFVSVPLMVAWIYVVKLFANAGNM